MRNFLKIAGRYGLALGSYALILLTTIGASRYLSLDLNLTFLMIATMIASAWYLGRGPGLLVAVVFELTLNYYATAPYTTRSGFITLNRMILFTSLVLFASSRRKAEKRLVEQREWLRVALASIGDAVTATDVKGNVIFINPTAEQLTGWTSKEAENKPLEEIFPIFNEETGEPVENPFVTVTREQNVVELSNHISLKTRDGKKIPIENSGAPIKDADEKIIGVIVVFHDVSERRRQTGEREKLLKSEQLARSEAESANRLKDEFLATVSHELRTPLNAILGWASMLSRGNLDESTKRNAVEVIERNAKAQAEIISDILDVSRIITGKLRIETHPIKLKPMIESAIETVKPAVEAKSLDLSVSLEENNDSVLGDADRLRQVVWNLLSNAIKFTPPNGRIEVSLKRVKSHLEIKVRDNGIGIEPEFLPHVFDRFRQADSSTTRLHSGLGLGLAIVRHLVELHGGEVAAESASIGQGTLFTVVLPVAAETHNAPAKDFGNGFNFKTKIAESNLQTDLTGLRVLLVDDEPDTLEVLRTALTEFGANVRTAVCSADALETFLAWKPNVLVSDLAMPNEDGFALISKIRALNSEQGSNIPALALTAYAREEDRLRALNAGFQTHISKPTIPETLAAEVKKLSNS